MTTARGNARFNIYEGKVIIDGIEVIIPVQVGDDIPDTIMGSLWLDIILCNWWLINQEEY